MLKVVMLILFAEIWNTVGQVFFKKGTNSLEAHSLRGLGAHIRFLKNVMAKPAVWSGFASMAIGLFIWFMALAEADLSIVSPLGSIQYILILIGAHFFLGEKINPPKLIGTLLIIAGIVLVTMS